MKSETLTMLLLLAGLAPGARARQTPEPEPETVFESASTAEANFSIFIEPSLRR